MGQALYRTHRPRKLSEIVGQEHTTTALKHALEKGTVSHAYLFTGPRGTGKTSIARILAHEINSLPYEDDATHLDIIEIDAASNRRIEEIRDLREKVHIAPTSAKYKVYIIDEVHMLTKEAFNALLKTLEEPPAHVIFILATTEAHKLPETIISRTQRFTFKPVASETVVAHLKEIAKQEKINITDEALELVAEHGDGSFRDSISLLDQARNQDTKITLEEVQRMLGIAPNELITQLIAALAVRDGLQVADLLTRIQNQGYEPAQVAKQLGRQLRADLLAGISSLPNTTILPLLGKLVGVPASADPRSTLEISLLDVALASSGSSPVGVTTTSQSAAVVTPPAVSQTPARPEPPAKETPASKSEPVTEQKKSAVSNMVTLDPAIWPEVLGSIKGHHNTLYGIVRGAEPQFSPGGLTLKFEHGFHKKQLEQKHNRDIISQAIEKLTGETVLVQCTLGAIEPQPLPSEPVAAVVEPAPAKKDNTLTSVSNIFGGGELLES